MTSNCQSQVTASGLSRMLHYVAERLVPIYFQLAEQLADSDILCGDDTSCRVIEVASYFNKAKAKKKRPPPWKTYRSPAAAEASIEQCRQRQQERQRRRADGDRQAKRSKDEEPSLGMLLGRVLAFESPRQDGTGGKQSLNTTVITGRAIAEDPQSLIVLYRSHLGGFGNLLESILVQRSPAARDVIVQADLTSTNLVRDPDLLQRFDLKLIGCSAHARRPFASAAGQSHQPGLDLPERILRRRFFNGHVTPPVRQNESLADDLRGPSRRDGRWPRCWSAPPVAPRSLGQFAVCRGATERDVENKPPT